MRSARTSPGTSMLHTPPARPFRTVPNAAIARALREIGDALELPRDEMTRRVLRAVESGRVH